MTTVNESNDESPTESPTEESKISRKLSEDDFRFVRTYMSPYSAHLFNLNHRKVIIDPSKSNPVYRILSPEVFKKYIKHNVKEVKNSAPTIAQLFRSFQVYDEDVGSDNEPTPAFFKQVNKRFASTLSPVMAPKGKPLYYYYVNLHGMIYHLNPKDTRRLYCMYYEKSITDPTTDAFKIVQLLVAACKSPTREGPIMILGKCVKNNTEHKTFIKACYVDMSFNFTYEYCLAEIIINYPDMTGCVWNLEEFR